MAGDLSLSPRRVSFADDDGEREGASGDSGVNNFIRKKELEISKISKTLK